MFPACESIRNKAGEALRSKNDGIRKVTPETEALILPMTANLQAQKMITGVKEATLGLPQSVMRRQKTGFGSLGP